MSSNSLR